MATRVVSAAGGNWNSTATWVGGVIPTTSDDIQLASTSGQLTVNVNASILGINLTAFYANTLTINASTTLTLTSTTFNNTFAGTAFSPTYNFLGTGTTQGRISKSTGAGSFNLSFAGSTEPIPCFQNNTSGIINATGDLYFTNLISGSNLNIDNSGGKVYISGDLNGSFSAVGGDTRYEMIGTGTLNVVVFGINGISSRLDINTSGTITISNSGFGFGNASTTAGTVIEFRHVAGTVVNPVIRANLNGINATGTQTLNLISGTTWDFYANNSTISSNFLTFVGNPQFDKFIINHSGSSTGTPTLTLGGVPIIVNEFNVINGITNNGGTYYRSALDLSFGFPFTMTVNSAIDLNGGSNGPNAAQTPTLEIKAGSGASPNLTINTYNQYVSRTRFTNINCSGGNTLYGQALTLTGTTNIQQYTLPPTGGGSSESAYTYFS